MRRVRHSSTATSLLAALLLCAAMIGCKGSDPSGPITTGSTKVPKIGSRFMFRTYTVDTNDVEKPETRGFDTVTVVQNGLNTGGRGGVIAVRYASSGELLYLHYLSNGDIEFAGDHSDGLWPAWTWRTFPIGSSSRSSVVSVVDTSNGHKRVFSDTLIAMGSEDIQVGSHTEACAKIREQVIQFDYEGAVVASRTVYLEDYWLAPSLGFFARYSDDANTYNAVTDSITWRREDFRMFLTGYELK
jgi:hypothetical protein